MSDINRELRELYDEADSIVTRRVAYNLHGCRDVDTFKLSMDIDRFIVGIMQTISYLLGGESDNNNTYVTMKCNWIPIGQTAVTSKEEYLCGSCGCLVNKDKSVYCEHCGSKLNWNDVRKKVDVNV